MPLYILYGCINIHTTNQTKKQNNNPPYMPLYALICPYMPYMVEKKQQNKTTILLICPYMSYIVEKKNYIITKKYTKKNNIFAFHLRYLLQSAFICEKSKPPNPTKQCQHQQKQDTQKT